MLSFPALEAIPRIRAVFTQRVPGVDVDAGREEVLARLEGPHEEARRDAGLGDMVFATAEQVHGNLVARVTPETAFPVPAADALLTTVPGICLGIYVADCAAVYLADRQGRGIALVHSGKKGTELGIAPSAARALCEVCAASPADLVAQISPCIRPPHYEVNFAREIIHQLRGVGVQEIHDCEICTASSPALYYSYRREMGRTGRMLAMMALLPG